MIKRKSLKYKTTYVPHQKHILPPSKKKHKSLIPSLFQHDLKIQLMATNLLEQISNNAVQECEDIKRAKAHNQIFLSTLLSLFAPYLHRYPDLNPPASNCSNEQPAPQPRYRVSRVGCEKKEKNGNRISVSMDETNERFKSENGNNSSNSINYSKQIINKLKKEYQNKVKLSPEYAHFVCLQKQQKFNELQYACKSLRTFKKYTLELSDQFNLRTKDRRQSKSNSLTMCQNECFLDTNGKIVRLKKVQKWHKQNSLAIIKVQSQQKQYLDTPPQENVKFKLKQTLVSPQPILWGGQEWKKYPSGEKAQSAITNGFKVSNKDCQIKKSSKRPSYRGRQSILKLPKIVR